MFTLQYDIKGPLATVFTPAAMASYLRVFQVGMMSMRGMRCAGSEAWQPLWQLQQVAQVGIRIGSQVLAAPRTDCNNIAQSSLKYGAAHTCR